MSDEPEDTPPCPFCHDVMRCEARWGMGGIVYHEKYRCKSCNGEATKHVTQQATEDSLPKLSDLMGLCKDSPIDVGGGWEMPRFIVCRICGNKRCPKAEDEKYKCTGSNKPGQICELEAADDEAESD